MGRAFLGSLCVLCAGRTRVFCTNTHMCCVPSAGTRALPHCACPQMPAELGRGGGREGTVPLDEGGAAAYAWMRFRRREVSCDPTEEPLLLSTISGLCSGNRCCDQNRVGRSLGHLLRVPVPSRTLVSPRTPRASPYRRFCSRPLPAGTGRLRGGVLPFPFEQSWAPPVSFIASLGLLPKDHPLL